jgi:predicted enzyme related to lactoylglutathione lyase
VDKILMRHGGLSYLEIPAKNPAVSAKFYQAVLGWVARDPQSNEPKFSDPGGYLIGRWITGRDVATRAGMLPFFYVEKLHEVMTAVIPYGGEVVKPVQPEGDLFIAVVKDPAGNTLGLWQAANA